MVGDQGRPYIRPGERIQRDGCETTQMKSGGDADRRRGPPPAESALRFGADVSR